ncbi:MAG: metallophosphoesterase [Desulfitobacterium hafniense]|nr:metallophosphoesterase [Desulfitobacterium hafniense]
MLVISFPVAEMSNNFLPDTAGLWLTILGDYSVVGVSYVFLLTLLIDALRLFDKGIGFVPSVIRKHTKTPLVIGGAIVLTVITILAYGGWNARNPVISEYNITINKKADPLKQLKIAMVSDIHYGSIIDIHRLNNLASIMQPDIILLAGDITDGFVQREEAVKLTDFLSQMPSKYGIYAVIGNHDQGLRSVNSELLTDFKKKGINLLRDSPQKIGESFYVVGRDYPGHQGDQERKEIGDLLKGVDSSLPIIMLDHQPIDLEKAQSNGVDLQLSGHTHVGQVFPMNLITGYLYELDWGYLKKGAYNLIVSSGYGTWGPPLRVGNNPEVVSITIKFKSKSVDDS